MDNAFRKKNLDQCVRITFHGQGAILEMGQDFRTDPRVVVDHFGFVNSTFGYRTFSRFVSLSRLSSI